MKTISDVAKLAGVSRASVSRVINNVPTVNEEIRKKVLKAMDELGFIPNVSARNLRTKQTKTIAVIVPLISNTFFSRLVQTMGIEAEKLGYKLLICQSRNIEKDELSFLDLLKTRQVDGVVMASVRNSWKKIKNYLQYGPVLMCNESFLDEEADIPSIKIDHEYGGYIAAQYLIKQGHKRIAFCISGDDSRSGLERKKGFLRAFQEFEIPFDESFVMNNAFDIESGREIFYQLLGLHERPTAVFTGSDEVAVGIISEANKNGVKVPEELAVVGFDDNPIAKIIQPSLTTIYQPIDDIAKTSIECMVQVLKGEKDFSSIKSVNLSIRLIKRESA
ncbi:DNA-binding LacI/PurR family transcriptional regulator [Anoxybacillus voinovskiensis]|uniref:DNA-binding LacI/PurR family transcriptional regulator n=1 Tax=Anoxybacteroides voinovskiense TaxID=230470 RepID=A0A840DJS6_9BACL|nr:LacI family DNA-binding transcriptional regulator [Anoxybacillus voinovskiensis]MBB4073060.1 DNA-binding LacI/PurR family transcriptional regulator [Anoxybacillus voinovskiensis]GGJ59781.1 LacI family transcriptional regulator [Anoxybacillus voinovskiensis]